MHTSQRDVMRYVSHKVKKNDVLFVNYGKNKNHESCRVFIIMLKINNNVKL